MLYTRKGDSGTTKAFDTKAGERISKSSCRTESLGALDELNSFLGIAKVKSTPLDWTVKGRKLSDIVAWSQNGLFIVQAEVAGADKRVTEDKVTEMEAWVDAIEAELPPIKTFFISGGTELAAIFDVCRTMARKAERRVIKAFEEDSIKVGPSTLAFLNRLSSLFYALARLTNHKSGIKEVPPEY
ncbi:MAG: cob(I)yrinic acid a,c-diamide adenosyltransferase [Candidatus Paceibacterota bacterium]